MIPIANLDHVSCGWIIDHSHRRCGRKATVSWVVEVKHNKQTRDKHLRVGCHVEHLCAAHADRIVEYAYRDVACSKRELIQSAF